MARAGDKGRRTRKSRPRPRGEAVAAEPARSVAFELFGLSMALGSAARRGEPSLDVPAEQFWRLAPAMLDPARLQGDEAAYVADLRAFCEAAGRPAGGVERKTLDWQPPMGFGAVGEHAEAVAVADTEGDLGARIVVGAIAIHVAWLHVCAMTLPSEASDRQLGYPLVIDMPADIAAALFEPALAGKTQQVGDDSDAGSSELPHAEAASDGRERQDPGEDYDDDWDFGFPDAPHSEAASRPDEADVRKRADEVMERELGVVWRRWTGRSLPGAWTDAEAAEVWIHVLELVERVARGAVTPADRVACRDAARIIRPWMQAAGITEQRPGPDEDPRSILDDEEDGDRRMAALGAWRNRAAGLLDMHRERVRALEFEEGLAEALVEGIEAGEGFARAEAMERAIAILGYARPGNIGEEADG